MRHLVACLVLVIAAQAMAQTYDFYPRTTGGTADNISWQNADNWYRYLTDEDHNLYPPTSVSGNYGSTSEFSAYVAAHAPPINTVPGAQTANEDTPLVH